ncbi:hypothetical protein D3C87_1322300 [compost metagenome]
MSSHGHDLPEGKPLAPGFRHKAGAQAVRGIVARQTRLRCPLLDHAAHRLGAKRAADYAATAHAPKQRAFCDARGR